ncbi:MAG: type I restriction enzyme HsdR N-terminal domain-containing protein [Muribaculaceae bacterium]|nr:type I restriction enzyme HsdR N-terminal domain-containing protein [Muribaculaceae bacterium]MBQ3961181.1 type I restriction enzyme HsdR N-terminal domain-containing protein [Muribaculaceae bacterium]MBQ5466537.1 type I restriction enzyme HsdR N-terminal domain-containing protein [Muribaculaceae bacterium]
MQLNLPTYTFNIKAKPNGSKVIFDTLRRRFVTLTPEEWVRQHFVRFLVDEKGFPAALMANEVSLTQNGIKRRCDTLVADATGNPLVIVEYKAPHIEISQNTFDQIVRYNMVLHASYLIVSNGLNHYCCRINYADDSYVFLNDIPSYSDLSNP